MQKGLDGGPYFEEDKQVVSVESTEFSHGACCGRTVLRLCVQRDSVQTTNVENEYEEDGEWIITGKICCNGS